MYTTDLDTGFLYRHSSLIYYTVQLELAGYVLSVESSSLVAVMKNEK